MTMLVRGGAAAAGSSLPTGATTGQVLQWNGSAWVAATPSASGTTPNATPSVPGLVQLAGDLGGTATAPTVAKINGSTPAPVATSGSYTDLTGRPALATVATSGSYTDLTGRPALATVATSGSYTDLTGRPALATVATSGSYGDLTGRPLLAAVATSGSYTDLTNTPAAPITGALTANYSTTSVALANLSELTLSNLATGRYSIEVYLYVDPSANTAATVTTGGTATVTGTCQATTTAYGPQLSDLNGGTTSVAVGANFVMHGAMQVTATGTFGVRVGSGSASAKTVIQAGAWIRLAKVA